MITLDELRTLERAETGCTRTGLRMLARVLNESGSDKAARVDVLRIICECVRTSHREPFELLRHRERLLDEVKQMYEAQIALKRGSRTEVESKLRDVQTLRDALADMVERVLLRKYERL